MQSRCDPPKFDQEDWSQFRFSRWHLNGVTLDAAAAAFAGLSERLFNSDAWRQHFQATLPALDTPGSVSSRVTHSSCVTKGAPSPRTSTSVPPRRKSAVTTSGNPSKSLQLPPLSKPVPTLSIWLSR